MTQKSGNSQRVIGVAGKAASPAALAPPRRRSLVLGALLLLAAIGMVYRGALRAPFLFDDRQTVLGNPSITQLWPLVGDSETPGPLRAPQDFPTAGRPVVNWTLAMNYQFGRLDPAGYHLLNILCHACSALLVWAIVRRTLALEFFAERFSGAAGPLGFMTALVWSVHPLNTETVVYVTQRTELLVALFYLATLAASLRSWYAAADRARWGWRLLAVAACYFGMGCKEVMVSAPLVVLLFERTFVAGSFRGALRASGPLYLGLASSWLLLVLLNYGGVRSQSAGFNLGVAPYVWWATQCKVLLMYLKLCVWPWPLSIHYEPTYLDTWTAAVPWVLPVLALIVATVLLVWRRTAAGFVLTWMFAILSPTLIVPIVTEIAVDRRMYLPLTALVALAVGAGYQLVVRTFAQNFKAGSSGRALRVTIAAGAVLAVALGFVSTRRLSAYADPVSIWQDALLQYPQSNVINANLASELLLANRPDDALAVSRAALQHGCDSRGVHNNLGAALTALGDRDGYQPGQLEEAIRELQTALEISPDFEDALVNLSFALLKAGQPAAALDYCTRAVATNPRNPQALYAQGTILTALARNTEAATSYQQALERDPTLAAAHYGLALVLLANQRNEEAIAHLRTALELDHRLPEAHYALAGALAAKSDFRAAAREYAAAIELRPRYPRALNNLGVVQMKLGETDRATSNFAEAVRQDPEYRDARENLTRAQQVKQDSNAGKAP